MAPRQCEIHSKTQPLQQKTCIFLLLKPQLRTQEWAYICMLWPTYTDRYSRIELRDTLNIYFQKQIFAHLKIYIFHFNTSQVNLISNQALNQPQALKFDHHWGTGDPSRKGYKMRCLQWGGFWTNPIQQKDERRFTIHYDSTNVLSQ